MAMRSNTQVLSNGHRRLIRQERRAQGISYRKAAAALGVNEATWRAAESGRHQTLFETLERMANVVGMTFVLVPIGGDVPESAPMPAPDHAPVAEPVVESASPRSRSVLSWLRSVRRIRGIRQDDMAKRLGRSEHRIRAYEFGDREPGFGDVARYAEECGFTVALVEPHTVPFTGLSDLESDAVRRLVTSYVRHLVREGKPVPPGLSDAADRLEKGTDHDN